MTARFSWNQRIRAVIDRAYSRRPAQFLHIFFEAFGDFRIVVGSVQYGNEAELVKLCQLLTQ